ncbi:MAG: hypothetical protein QW701_02665 [Candidatus Nezhaarchaeales archaeon]
MRFPFFKCTLLLSFTIYSTIKFLEADAVASLFAWFSAVMAISLALDVLSLLKKEVSEKLAVALMLIAISGGGVLANIIILLSYIDLWIKVFSLALLIVVHTPLLVAVAYILLGKSKLSRKFVKEFYLPGKLKD